MHSWFARDGQSRENCPDVRRLSCWPYGLHLHPGKTPLRARGACRLTYSYVKGQLPYVIFARERGPTRTFEQMSCTFGSISYVIAGRLGRGAQYVNLRNTLNCVLLIPSPVSSLFGAWDLPRWRMSHTGWIITCKAALARRKLQLYWTAPRNAHPDRRRKGVGRR